MSTRKRKRSTQVPVCKHSRATFEPSPAAKELGFDWAVEDQRLQAAQSQIRHELPTFPGPLVLPEDEIALYPRDRGQTFNAWLKGKYRNKVTPERRTIYIVPPPVHDPKLSFVSEWSKVIDGSTTEEQDQVDISEIVEYVSAFYHGLPIKLLPKESFKFSPWEDTSHYVKRLQNESGKTPTLIGADVKGQRIGVRTRVAPDKRFSRQLNVNDLIDVAITLLPKDAYAMVILVDQDLYEEDEDMFICGRAYGGSRVAIISSARYNPSLDEKIGLDVLHAWPNSHCVEYMKLWDLESIKIHKPRRGDVSPMSAALKSAISMQREKTETSSARWLGRLCRTVTHELGHCFGMGHCVHYACCMQGSASLHEDIRQPPYLCPIDLAKVLHATGATEREHLYAMMEYCQKHTNVELFAAYGAWLKMRINLLSDSCS